MKGVGCLFLFRSEMEWAAVLNVTSLLHSLALTGSKTVIVYLQSACQMVKSYKSGDLKDNQSEI